MHLLGLNQPDSGNIHLECSETKEIIGPNTRQHFVFVPQGNSLMSGTICYNLFLAKPDATNDELKEVLQIACADFVFELPDGLETELGERGSGLSEGQD